jgi:prepilin-type N-terminal cleavage/methylation domain-containing protein
MIRRLRRRLVESGGYTLSEMLVVLAILLVVVAALAQLFSSASNAQNDMSNRFQAQQDARVALDKLRRELHCAKSVSGTVPGRSITVTLGSYCPTTTTGATGDLSFTWCTRDKAGGTGTPDAGDPYSLWRYPGNTCPISGSLAGQQKWADYLTTGQVFTAYVAPQGGSSWVPATAYTVGGLVRPTDTTATPYVFTVTVAGTSGDSEPAWPTALNATVTNGTVTFKNVGPLDLGQLSIDLPVDLTPADTRQLYDLKDNIVLRNTTR